MSGQSANMTLAESKACQERVQASGSQACSHEGGKKKGGKTPIDKKVSHQG